MKRWFFAALVIFGGLWGCGGPKGVPSPKGISLPESEGWPKHKLEVRRLISSLDGRFLATISADELLLWELPELKPYASVKEIPSFEFVKDVAISPGGEQIVVLDEYSVLYLWESSTLKVRGVIPLWGMAPSRLVGFGPEGMLYWVSTEGRLISWRPQPTDYTEDAVELGEVGYVLHIGGAPNGYLLWGRRAWQLRFEEEGPRLESVEAGSSDEVMREAAHALESGTLLAGEEGVVRVSPSGEQTLLRGHASRVVSTALSADGESYGIAYEDGLIELWGGGSSPRYSDRVSTHLVREVFPKRVLELTFGVEHLWVLLPTQQLLGWRLGSWEQVGPLDL